MQGLIPAVQHVFPDSEHRFCVRHLYSNFQEKFKGEILKNQLWACARSSSVEQWTRNMEKMKTLNEDAYKWLEKMAPNTWVRAYFSEFPKCDILLNNNCEVFNKYILDARELPIMSMFEKIKCQLMTRHYNKQQEMAQEMQGGFCPKIKKKVAKNADFANLCYALPSGQSVFQVQIRDYQHIVDINAKTCDCRRWQLTGVPCCHAIACLRHERIRPESMLPSCYSVDAFNKAYGFNIWPCKDRSQWQRVEGPEVLPPVYEKKVGRPPKSRKKQPHEIQGKHGPKLSRHGVTIHCKHCSEADHNSGGCKLKKMGFSSEEAKKLVAQTRAQLQHEAEITAMGAAAIHLEQEQANVGTSTDPINQDISHENATATMTQASTTLLTEMLSQFRLKGSIVSLLLLFTLAALVQRVGCPVDESIQSIHDNYLEHAAPPPPPPRPATENPCGNHTVRCVRAESGWEYVVPSFSSFLSVLVFLPPIWRVLRLQPTSRGPETTLLWWFFCLGAAAYILWSFYFMHCRDRHYAVFPIFWACIIGAVVHSLLVLVTIMQTSAERDKRLAIAGLIGAACFLGGSVFSKTHGLGWIALGLSVLSHLCRLGSTNYHVNFTKSSMYSCIVSVVGGVSALLWLLRPNLCISLEYKLSSYIVGCFRGVEVYLWGCRPVARRYLSRIEGQSLQ